MKPVEMMQDDRPIDAVWWPVDDPAQPLERHIVGRDGVTAIVCYGEPSHYCARPFFAIYHGGEIVKRLDATNCGVEYKRVP